MTQIGSSTDTKAALERAIGLIQSVTNRNKQERIIILITDGYPDEMPNDQISLAKAEVHEA